MDGIRRLVQVNSTANWGSTGRIAEEIGQLAMQNGWVSYIAYGRHANESKSQIIKIGNKTDQAFHLAGTRLFDLHGRMSVAATRRLISQIEVINPDIVHLHNIHGYYLNYPTLFNFLQHFNRPVVWTLHDCWSFTGHCAHFDYNKCSKWKDDECRICLHRNVYPATRLRCGSAKNFELKRRGFISLKNLHLVPVSQWLAGLLKESFLKNCDIRVINNGVNTEVFKPIVDRQQVRLDYGLSKDAKLLLGVASVWDKRKGLDDFYRLRDALPREKYCLILVGLSDRQIAMLPEGIIGIKRTNSTSKLAELYSAADAFLNLTYEDTFPTTNIESLACGTPVITYRTGGSPESLDENVGIVVTQGDIIGIVNAVDVICNNKNTDKYTTDACRNRAVTYYNKNDRYREYMNLYASLL